MTADRLKPMALDEVERRLAGQRDVVWDTEGSGLDWKRNQTCGYVLTFGPRPDETTYLPIRHKGGGNLDPRKTLGAIRSGVKKNPGMRIIGHSLGFDLKFMSQDGIPIDSFDDMEDTLINAFLINEHQPGGFSLDASARYVGAVEKKGEELYKYLAAKFGGVPNRDQMGNFHKLAGDDPVGVDYAVGDGESTWDLWARQQKELDDQELRPIWDIECRTIRALTRMELLGVKVDEERLEQVHRIVKSRYDKALSSLPKNFNVNAPSQLRKLFTDAGLTDWPKTPPSKNFPDGQPSFAEPWMQRSKLGKSVIAVRKLKHLIDSFLVPLIEKHLFNGRVHTTFNQTRGEDFGTITGRLSSSNPNMQQIHKRNEVLGSLFRSVFVPDDGKEMAGADYNQCLVAGTQVMVPGGTKNIEDMKVDDWVYSYDNARRLCLRRVTWAGQTGVRSVCRLKWITNGRTKGHLDVTPDHKIRLLDGSYKTVSELAEANAKGYRSRYPYFIRVLALRRGRQRVRRNEPYRNFLWTTGTNRIKESRFVFEQTNHGWSPEIVHHYDENTLNDNPDNLVGVTFKEHAAIHGTYGMRDLTPGQRKERSMIATHALQQKFRVVNNHIITHIIPLPGEHPVYDITVEDTHNFIANEICVHNCEPRLLAHFGDVQLLIDGYLSDPPIDAHSMVAKGANIDRQSGKTLNQALLTGAGDGKAAIMLNKPMGEAMFIVNAYFRSMPEIKPFQRNVIGVYRNRGYLTSLLGRRMRLDDPRFAYKGPNRILQGGNADIIKESMARVDDLLVKEGQGTQMLLNVHDDIVYQYPKGDRTMLERAIAIMEDYGPDNQSTYLTVPMVVDAKSGRNWGEASYGADVVAKSFKEMDAIYKVKK